MVQNDSYKLCKMLEEVAGCKVYFNSGERMEYPCIRIQDTSISHVFANNHKYLQKRSYQGYFITRDCEDPIIDKLDELRCIDWASSYRGQDNLYHYPFVIKHFTTK